MKLAVPSAGRPARATQYPTSGQSDRLSANPGGTRLRRVVLFEAPPGRRDGVGEPHPLPVIAGELAPDGGCDGRLP